MSEIPQRQPATEKTLLSPAALRRLMVAAGIAISLLMVARGQVGGDQLNLLARGWRLAAHGDLVPHGNPLSNGGNEPGALTSLLMGLPLYVWMDNRAPALLLWITHLAAWLLLDRTLRRILSPQGRTLFCLFYWLNPWQLYYAGVLWNPGYLFLCGAVHLWSAWTQRDRARFGASFAHALVIGLAAQLHPSALILVFASAFLFWRRYLRVHWGGLLAGGALASITLLPWIAAVQADHSLLPGGKGFPFRGLVLVLPMLRGVLYWLRYSAFSVLSRMTHPDFTPALGAAADSVAAPIVNVAREALGLVGMALSALGAWRFIRRRRVLVRPNGPAVSPRAWLKGYVLWAACGALVSFALSPTTIMGWQAFIVLHAAVLPPVLWLEAWLRTPRGRRWPAALVPAYAGLAVAILFAMAVASPDYRCRGRSNVNLTLLADHPMFHDLGISERCPFPVDPVGGWWPDALPRPVGGSAQ
jgi:hypothetical protein